MVILFLVFWGASILSLSLFVFRLEMNLLEVVYIWFLLFNWFSHFVSFDRGIQSIYIWGNYWSMTPIMAFYLLSLRKLIQHWLLLWKIYWVISILLHVEFLYFLAKVILRFVIMNRGSLWGFRIRIVWKVLACRFW